MSVTNTPIQLDYFVRDIAGAVATYNRLRWFRSKDGPYGTFEGRTAATAGPAVLATPKVEPHELNGKTLSFMVGGVSQVDVVFADADPVTTAQAVIEINGATGLVVATAGVDGEIIITSATTGGDASIEILDGDANLALGFAAGDGAIGTDPDTVLVGGTHQYYFTDDHSDRDYWYKVHFLNTGTAATSVYSVPFPANQVDKVPTSQTIVCYIRLADLTGCPIEGRKITLFNMFSPNVAGGFGIFRHAATVSTDRNGYAEIRLVRGLEVDMSIGGTGFVRRLTIPSTGDAVDLLDPALVTRDEFGIQEMDVDFAVRTS